VRALQGFTHEEWTDSGGSDREGNEIAASQSLTTLVYPQSYRPLLIWRKSLPQSG
jgi:hypothetical protein